MAKPRKNKHDGDPVIANRRARHEYHFTDTLEVGIVLEGSEVKSIREGRASIAEGYVRAELEPAPRLMLHSTTVQEYGPAAGGHAPTRVRTLLAHKRQIGKLHQQAQQKGVTIIPLRMYFKNGKVKVEIGLGTGKAKHDKRQDIRERESDRALRRAMSKKM